MKKILVFLKNIFSAKHGTNGVGPGGTRPTSCECCKKNWAGGPGA